MPETVYEACTLLRFAAQMVEQNCDGEGGIVPMIKSAEAGLCAALRGEDAATRENLKAERAKGFAEGWDDVRTALEIIAADRDWRRERAQQDKP